jgi:hypothetical protein
MKPFDSIESAREFIVLLEESIGEAMTDVKDAGAESDGADDPRRAEALALALFKMNQLSIHVHKSRCLLDDLCSIRRQLAEKGMAAGV